MICVGSSMFTLEKPNILAVMQQWMEGWAEICQQTWVRVRVRVKVGKL